LDKWYKFTGPQGPPRKYGPNKGVMQAEKARKRQEAQDRQKRYMKNSQMLAVQTEALDINGIIELNTTAA